MRVYEKRLSATSLVNKMQSLREIKGGHSCISLRKILMLIRKKTSPWIEQKQRIFETVEEKNASK